MRMGSRKSFLTALSWRWLAVLRPACAICARLDRRRAAACHPRPGAARGDRPDQGTAGAQPEPARPGRTSRYPAWRRAAGDRRQAGERSWHAAIAAGCRTCRTASGNPACQGRADRDPQGRGRAISRRVTPSARKPDRSAAIPGQAGAPPTARADALPPFVMPAKADIHQAGHSVPLAQERHNGPRHAPAGMRPDDRCGRGA